MEYPNFQEEQMKASINVQADYAKKQNSMNYHYQLLEMKSLYHEQERELRKTQCEVLTINSEGEVNVETKNLRTKKIERQITNFSHPELIKYVRASNPQEKIYLITIDLNEKICKIFLAPEKSGSSTYLLNKFAEVGGVFFGRKISDQKAYARQLMTLLIRNCKEKIIVPDQRGWYIDEHEKIRFFDKKWSWREARKCTC